MWQVSDIKWVDWDISSVCNAGCIDCVRWLPDSDNHYHLNGHHPAFNQLYDPRLFADHITQFDDLEYVQLLGNVGDPMANAHIDQMVHAVARHHQSARIEINTNGSLGSESVWQRLIAAAVEVSDRINMVFSIDGLEHTNHIYRRGCDWHRILERAKWWLAAGLDAEWKMIDFPFNADQRDSARDMARDMGFKQFTVFPRQTPTAEFDQLIIDHSQQPQSTQLYQQSYQADWHDQYDQQMEILHAWHPQGIAPKCQSQHSSGKGHHVPNFQINVDSSVWPCSWTSCMDSQKNQPLRLKWHQINQHYETTLGQGWNQLKHRSLAEILNSPWFKHDLAESWQDSQFSLSVCWLECGACKPKITVDTNSFKSQ